MCVPLRVGFSSGETMKNTLHMFTDLNTGLKVPFALSKFTTAQPLGASPEAGGTIIYGVGVPNGIRIQESLLKVNEVVKNWHEIAGSAATN
jgi:hypothetical protein